MAWVLAVTYLGWAGRFSLRSEYRSLECESPQGFLYWGAEMRIESTNAGPREVWLTWDEDRSMGRVTARCFVFDDAIDRVVWAMDRARDGVTADVAIGAGLPIF
ncbi:hypothetical protein [Burkholderia cenocepacia]|uniref:hypothetical protein n=1 Tax=Burkholderia cenocepacia TaxID=95486 RepID=UPI0028BE3168|nr:hypothetical protein [Burkholderia cenocepacia]